MSSEPTQVEAPSERAARQKWKLVPVELTPEMEDAVEKAELRHLVEDRKRGGHDPELSNAARYKAALSAAPTPEAPEQPTREEGPGYNTGHLDLDDLLTAAYWMHQPGANMDNGMEFMGALKKVQQRLDKACNEATQPTQADAPSEREAFEDSRVQAVYDLLCDETPPPKGEHWEGFAARRIVAAMDEHASRIKAALEEHKN